MVEKIEEMANETNDKVRDLDSLIARSKEGKLSTSEINEAVEEMELDNESLDKLYDELEDSGIPLPDDISNVEMLEIESEVEAFGTSENMERILEQEGLAIDDPVRMYLKEIGRVPLLGADRERELAEIMSGDSGEDVKTAAKKELVEANLRLVQSESVLYTHTHTHTHIHTHTLLKNFFPYKSLQSIE